MVFLALGGGLRRRLLGRRLLGRRPAGAFLAVVFLAGAAFLAVVFLAGAAFLAVVFLAGAAFLRRWRSLSSRRRALGAGGVGWRAVSSPSAHPTQHS